MYEVCHISDRIFALHPKFRRANFYSQQLRILKLVENVSRRVKLQGKTAVVVGAGVSGLTAAAALFTLKASVSIIEERSPLHKYREAVHREIHPNLIFWPFQDLRAITNLPFLNWSYGSADRVRAEIMTQWNKYYHSHVNIESGTVLSVEDNGHHATINLSSGRRMYPDLIILAVGFQQEKDISGTKPSAPEYWAPYSAREMPVIVSGTGDGGLIDVAYQFYGVSAVKASRIFAYKMNPTPLKRVVALNEQIAMEYVNNNEIDRAYNFLNDFYSRIQFSNEAVGLLRQFETDIWPHVILYHRDPHPYSPFSAPVNKLLLSLCAERFNSCFQTERAELTISPLGWPVRTLVGSDSTATEGQLLLAFDKGSPSGMNLVQGTTIIRHGATHALDNILTNAQKDKLNDNIRDHSDILNGVTRDEFNFKLYCGMSANRLSPTSRHSGEEFTALIWRLLGSILGESPIPFKPGQTARDRNGNLTIYEASSLPQHVREQFPITIQGLTIRLVAGRRKRYTYNANRGG